MYRNMVFFEYNIIYNLCFVFCFFLVVKVVLSESSHTRLHGWQENFLSPELLCQSCPKVGEKLISSEYIYFDVIRDILGRMFVGFSPVYKAPPKKRHPILKYRVEDGKSIENPQDNTVFHQTVTRPCLAFQDSNVTSNICRCVTVSCQKAYLSSIQPCQKSLHMCWVFTNIYVSNNNSQT